MNSEWASLLAESLQDKGDTIPDGWKSVDEIAKEIGKSKPHTGHLVRQWLAEGRLETRTFRVAYASIGNRNVPYYRRLKPSELKIAA